MIFAVVYPKQDYDRQAFYYVCSWLKNLIEDYLVYSAAQAERDLSLTRIYRQKGLEKHFVETVKNTEKKAIKQPLRDADFHLSNFRLQQEKLEYAGQQSRRNTENLQAATTELTLYFISEKLKHT